MSYSFNVRAATALLALAACATKMDEVVASQPVHEADKDHAMAAVEAFVALVPAIDGHDYSVTVNGAVYAVDGALRGASVSVNVGLIKAET